MWMLVTFQGASSKEAPVTLFTLKGVSQVSSFCLAMLGEPRTVSVPARGAMNVFHATVPAAGSMLLLEGQP